MEVLSALMGQAAYLTRSLRVNREKRGVFEEMLKKVNRKRTLNYFKKYHGWLLRLTTLLGTPFLDIQLCVCNAGHTIRIAIISLIH
jgi:hypothetical protein